MDARQKTNLIVVGALVAILIIALLAHALQAAALQGTNLSIDWQQECASGNYDAIPNAGGGVTITCYLSTPTPEPTDTGTPTATETPEPTETPTPEPTSEPAVNLLANGNFTSGFDGWSMANGHWQPHRPISCESSGTMYAQMDIDGNSSDTWSVGDEDWLWQDVAAPQPHSAIILSLTEAHHMHSGTAEVRLFGSADGVNWIEVFHRPGVEAAYGAGKCAVHGPPEQFTYEVAANYLHYRLQIYGRINELDDGWLIGGLSLVAVGEIETAEPTETPTVVASGTATVTPESTPTVTVYLPVVTLVPTATPRIR